MWAACLFIFFAAHSHAPWFDFRKGSVLEGRKGTITRTAAALCRVRWLGWKKSGCFETCCLAGGVPGCRRGTFELN